MLETILDTLRIIWAIAGILVGAAVVLALIYGFWIVLRYVAEWCWEKLLG